MKRIYVVEVYHRKELVWYQPFTNNIKAKKYRMKKEKDGYETTIVQ